jgi:hypothetical protein
MSTNLLVARRRPKVARSPESLREHRLLFGTEWPTIMPMNKDQAARNGMRAQTKYPGLWPFIS